MLDHRGNRSWVRHRALSSQLFTYIVYVMTKPKYARDLRTVMTFGRDGHLQKWQTETSRMAGNLQSSCIMT